MPEPPKELQLLLKVFEDLQDFLPYLVLVGGWVLYLYARFLWKGIRHEPLTTVDIDFGFKYAPDRKSETITDRFRKKHYGEHHLTMDRPVPFVPVVRIEKGDLKADVEFITAPETAQSVKNKLVGREIKVNEILDFDILLESPIKITVDGKKVSVPSPAVFTFHKLLTFKQRERPDKQQKDLCHAYYVLFFSPEKERLVQEVSNLISSTKQGRRVRDNIEKYFEDVYAKGPTLILEGSGGSAMRMLVPDIRRDAYEKIISLLRK